MLDTLLLQHDLTELAYATMNSVAAILSIVVASAPWRGLTRSMRTGSPLHGMLGMTTSA
ncbi:hypothetical protein [Mycobacterium leprae]|uniref:hypothetical protein n=1 Tax=Mycobacterium leprae TaxID=1769 RepID=UPI000B2C709A|nr:hypothetical protein [Mycobacterium leprae]